MSAEAINGLHHQLSVARSEINNLRKQLIALKQTHNKEIGEIRKRLDGNQWKKQEPIDPIDRQISFKPIGTVSSDFTRIRGIPRQPTIAKDMTAKLKLNKDIFNNPKHALQDLDRFSHMWILFVFHIHDSRAKSKVAPPRLDGARTGVLASRSPHRPCPIGLSLVKIERITDDVIYFSGVDMVDETPVLDVKPYIPQYDHPGNVEVKVPEWIRDAPVHKLNVNFTDEALKQLQEIEPELFEDRQKIICKILSEDPRSVYLRQKLGPHDSYRWEIGELLVECRFENQEVEIIGLFRN